MREYGGERGVEGPKRGRGGHGCGAVRREREWLKGRTDGAAES